MVRIPYNDVDWTSKVGDDLNGGNDGEWQPTVVESSEVPLTAGWEYVYVINNLNKVDCRGGERSQWNIMVGQAITETLIGSYTVDSGCLFTGGSTQWQRGMSG